MLWLTERTYGTKDCQWLRNVLEAQNKKFITLPNAFVISKEEERIIKAADSVIPYGSVDFVSRIRSLFNLRFKIHCWLDTEASQCSSFMGNWAGHLFNETGVFVTWGQLYQNPRRYFTQEKMFIRPNSSLKQFAGTVLWLDNFYNWCKGVNNMCQSDLVFLSEAKPHKWEEYRFFIVEKRIVARSRLSMVNEVRMDAKYDEERVDKWINGLLNVWYPDDAFVFDFCVLPDGTPKVIEINSVNCSGFYNCSIADIVGALEMLVLTENGK